MIHDLHADAVVFNDLGTGCCVNRNTNAMLFKGFTDDLAACKAKCTSIHNCGHIEYGWEGSTWCTVLAQGTDCSELADGASDCDDMENESSGGDNGVRTYQFLSVGIPSETGKLSPIEPSSANNNKVIEESKAGKLSSIETTSNKNNDTKNIVSADATSLAKSTALADMADLGAGCCASRNPETMLFKGNLDDLAACKAKCASIADCGFAEYGWKDSKWCTALSKSTDCSELADGVKDCGLGGGDNGVHTYELLETSADAGVEAVE